MELTEQLFKFLRNVIVYTLSAEFWWCKLMVLERPPTAQRKSNVVVGSKATIQYPALPITLSPILLFPDRRSQNIISKRHNPD